MAGIYIHIPFCKKKCNYCNFFSVASLKNKNAFLDSLKIEIEAQKDYLKNDIINTIYFGGGTPSLLSVTEISAIIDQLNKFYNISENPEITIECNPDDLTKQKIKELRQTSINRFSIGIQSFFQEDLNYLDRTHDKSQAENAIKYLQDSGFENLTIDLIYGIPTSTKSMWEQNLEKFFSFRIPHLSAYSLTVEPKTILHHQIKNKKLIQPEENKSIEQFKILLEKSRENNFIHYEISNFAKEGYFSKHNSNYWLSKNYLGLGPSAHSFNGVSRQWNISNIRKYIEIINNKNIIAGKEILTEDQQYNEYVLTSLRTIWGCNSDYITNKFGQKYYEFFIRSSKKFIDEKMILKSENVYTLSETGKLFADGIASEMFSV